MGKSVGRQIETVFLDADPERVSLTALPPRAGRKDEEIFITRGEKRPEIKDAPLARSHALVRALSLTVIVAALAGVWVLSHHVATTRAFDAVAFNDVLSVLKALDKSDHDAVLDLTIRGPGTVPGLPGASISEGSTLQIRRGRNGEVFVRGTNDQGTLTYRFFDGTLYASEE